MVDYLSVWGGSSFETIFKRNSYSSNALALMHNIRLVSLNVQKVIEESVKLEDPKCDTSFKECIRCCWIRNATAEDQFIHEYRIGSGERLIKFQEVKFRSLVKVNR